MIDPCRAYQVIVPPELAGRLDALSTEDHRRLSGRLKRAARSAQDQPVEWLGGVPGRHRGRHRAVTGDLWVLYQLDEERRTVSLLEFGKVEHDADPAGQPRET